MAQHPDPEIISSVMSDLGSLKVPFVTDDLAEPFAAYVRSTLGPARERYGIEPLPGDPEDVRLLRPLLIAWLGGEGRDPEVMEYCRRAADAYVNDPASVDATIAGAVLGVAARGGDRARFELYRAKSRAAKVPADRSRYLTALGKFEDPALQDEVLRYALVDEVRVTDRWPMLVGLFATERGRDKVYAWMTENYDAIAAGLPTELMAYMPFFVSGCEERRLQTAREFFAEPTHRVDGTEANLAKVAEQITDCLNLRAREGEAVANYLRSLSP
jgi:alanyl aminopeptidase